MTAASDTPRTDREVYVVSEKDIGFEVVSAGLCRQIEQERDELVEKFYKALRERNDMAREMEKLLSLDTAPVWQPIASAPKDGKPIFLWMPYDQWMIIGAWQESAGYWANLETHEVDIQPAYWHPLPKPPRS